MRIQEHVAGRDIPVHYALAVQVIQHLCQWSQHGNDLTDTQRAPRPD